MIVNLSRYNLLHSCKVDARLPYELLIMHLFTNKLYQMLLLVYIYSIRSKI
jgi:hypothetical protein